MWSDVVLPGNASAAGEHLVQHAAERPDVRPLVDRLPARLLRAHVRRRAQDDAFVRITRRQGR